MITISFKKIFIALIIIALVAMAYLSNAFVVQRGYSSIFSFLNLSVTHAIQGQPAKLELSIEIKPKHFKKIEQVRNDALKRGVIIQPEDPYVPCELTYKGGIIKGEIRLKGKMTDHVSGKKWSFRVKTKKNDAFMGMQRFTLQHPGTRGYVYEWLHHEMCKREGIIALRYEFINLTVNGDNLGVYAVEENFGQPLVQNNNRPKGPVFRFNPTLYWQARLNAMQRVYIAQEFTNFQHAHVEAFSKKETFTDSSLKESFIDANILMNKVRWGEVQVADAFDVKKLAMRYALLDLCGGYHSVDWSDVKFYYNPVLKKIEPVAYESFGPRFIDHIIGNYRFTDTQEAFPNDYHDIIFSDSSFFAAYIQALRTVSKPGYFEAVLASVQEELDKRVAIQYSEFPYKDFNLEVFRHNLKTIRKTLEAPKNFHAFLSGRSRDSITLQLQVIESLPTEVLGIRVKGTVFLLPVPVVLPALGRKHRPVFKTLKWALDSTVEVDTERGKDLEVLYRLLGDTAKHSCEVFPYEIHAYNQQKSNAILPVVFSKAQDFITIDSTTKSYFINRSDALLDQAFAVPLGWTLKATAPLTLTIGAQGSLQVEGSLDFKGIEDEPIVVAVNSAAPNWLSIMPGGGPSEWKRVICNLNSNSSILLYGVTFAASELEMRGSAQTFIEAFNTEISLSHSSFESATKSALELSFCKASGIDLRFVGCNKGIDSKAGTLVLQQCLFRELTKGIETKRKDQVQLEAVTMDGVQLGVEVQDGALLTWSKGKVSNAELFIKVHRKGNRYAPAQATCAAVDLVEVKETYVLEKDNSLVLDGVEQTPNKP